MIPGQNGSNGIVKGSTERSLARLKNGNLDLLVYSQVKD